MPELPTASSASPDGVPTGASGATSRAPVVPGYVLEELLGRGGSGQVWRARPRSGGPPVAVKVLVRGDTDRQEREAALLGRLDHPHLVRLHEVVRRDVRSGPAEVSLVLDLLDGGSLAALLARRGRLRPGEVVTTVAPVAAALAHAHEQGVVHGDLSPGNVVFTAAGRPVLTDLGTARLVGDLARAEVTPPYVDPVVARGGAPGQASDVFGVAAAAFHALTGIAPWNAAGPAATLEVAAAGELPDLALLAPEAPAELVAVVRRGLSPDPHLRGSAAAFALDLRHACRPEPVRLPVSGVPDEVLGATGSGPHTELTHQVPGRRAEARHAAEPAGRLSRRWAALVERRPPGAAGGGSGRWGTSWPAGRGARWARVAVALTAVAAALVGAAWLGLRWGGGADTPVPVAHASRTADVHPGSGADSAARTPTTATAPATAGRPATATAPATAGRPATAGAPTTAAAPRTPTPAAPAPTAAGGAGRPTDDAGWMALVGRLYERRAAAFATADAAPLADVYTGDSPLLARDHTQVAALAGAGRRLHGFVPQVRRVTAVTSRGDDAVVLELVDVVPDCTVVPDSDPTAAGQRVPGRGEADVRMVLSRTGAGWRIAEATRQ